MLGLQKPAAGSVRIEGRTVGAIGAGLLVLLAVRDGQYYRGVNAERACQEKLITEDTLVELLDRARDGFRDVVVANAAILIAEPIAEADAEKWRAVMNVNLFGYFLVTKHACRVMKQQRSGSIVNINSKSGKKGSAANSAYAASKFGGVGLTQSLAFCLESFMTRVLPSGESARCRGHLHTGMRCVFSSSLPSNSAASGIALRATSRLIRGSRAR